MLVYLVQFLKFLLQEAKWFRPRLYTVYNSSRILSQSVSVIVNSKTKESKVVPTQTSEKEHAWTGKTWLERSLAKPLMCTQRKQTLFGAAQYIRQTMHTAIRSTFDKQMREEEKLTTEPLLLCCALALNCQRCTFLQPLWYFFSESPSLWITLNWIVTVCLPLKCNICREKNDVQVEEWQKSTQLSKKEMMWWFIWFQYRISPCETIQFCIYMSLGERERSACSAVYLSGEYNESLLVFGY